MLKLILILIKLIFQSIVSSFWWKKRFVFFSLKKISFRPWNRNLTDFARVILHFTRTYLPRVLIETHKTENNSLFWKKSLFSYGHTINRKKFLIPMLCYNYQVPVRLLMLELYHLFEFKNKKNDLNVPNLQEVFNQLNLFFQIQNPNDN